MSERVELELALLREIHPDLEWRPDVHWVRLPAYQLPDQVWSAQVVQLAFQIPQNLPGQAPYGFWVRPGLSLKSGGTISNYSYPVTTPFGEGWGQFSWSPEEWRPAASVRAGTNMLDFVRSFADRLREGA